MSLTVLEIVQQALWPVSGETPPASSITSTSVSKEIKLRNILYDVARKIRRHAYFPQMKRSHSFDLTASVTKYQLPQDFWEFVADTDYDSDQQFELGGPLPDSAFVYKSIWGAGDITTNYRLFGFDANPNSAGGQFHVYPTPAGGETLQYDYYSKNLFLPPNWLPSTAYTSGTYVNANGNIYLCDTDGTSGTTAPSATTANISDGTTQWDYVSAPYETIQTSSDLCIFDDEAMILGVRAGFLNGTGKNYLEEDDEFMKAVNKAKFRLTGMRQGSFGGRRSSKRYRPEKARGWSI